MVFFFHLYTADAAGRISPPPFCWKWSYLCLFYDFHSNVVHTFSPHNQHDFFPAIHHFSFEGSVLRIGLDRLVQLEFRDHIGSVHGKDCKYIKIGVIWVELGMSLIQLE